MSDTFKTRGTMSAYYYEFEDDDEKDVRPCVLSVAEVRDNGEIELHWNLDETGRYIDFRLSDLMRAIKEMKDGKD